MNKFLVFLEQREGVVKKASVSLWNRIQVLAALRGDSVVSGILVGPADIRQLDGVIAGDGVIYHAKAESCRLYNQECYTRVVADIFQREACTALYFADTAMSRELAPRLSVRLQASLLTGCTMSDPALDCVSRPVYSGSFLASFVPKRHQRLFILSSSASISSYSAGGHIDFIDVDPQSVRGDLTWLKPELSLLEEEVWGDRRVLLFLSSLLCFLGVLSERVGRRLMKGGVLMPNRSVRLEKQWHRHSILRVVYRVLFSIEQELDQLV